MPDNYDHYPERLQEGGRLRLVYDIFLLIKEHEEKVSRRHHLQKELDTLHEPPETRHSLQKFQYDESMREAREAQEVMRSGDAAEGKPKEKGYKALDLCKPISENKGKDRKRETARQRRLDSIKKDIEKIDEQINKTCEEKETEETRLERKIKNIQQTINNLDEQFSQQIRNEENIEELREMQGGLIDAITEIEQNINDLESSITAGR